MCRRAAIGTVAALSISSLLTGTASAHNVAMPAAKAKARAYALTVLNDPDLSFISANTSCVRAFTGHNHFIRCTEKYDTEETKTTKDYACTERIDVYLLPQASDRASVLFTRHTTRPCGNTTLTGPQA
jgi:hypothetical protein